jgi:quercetin dioxygenase-like cupin family protein
VSALPIEVNRWTHADSPAPDTLLRELATSGHTYFTWANGPHDTYPAHSHHYGKRLVCLEGSIVFELPATGERVELRPGDLLMLPAEMVHAATVGAHGVRCAEAHLNTE